jgi:gamma-glutamyltranspeptidase/glutathione hydrolase
VVLIQSVFHSFGARLMEPETGIIVQNRGAAFSLEPDVPYRLAPGRRPPHTLMPVMVRMGGRVAWLSGAMGGKAQPQIQAELLGRLLDLGQSPAEAVSAARWVVGGLDIGSAEDVVRLEGRLDDLRGGFEWGGLQTARLADYDEEVGQAQVIAIQQDGFVAAADPRSDGAAAAW